MLCRTIYYLQKCPWSEDSQFHRCWCIDSLRREDISSHGNDCRKNTSAILSPANYWGYFSFALRHRYMGCLFNGFNSDLWSTFAVAIICTIASLNGPCYIISGPYLVVSWAVYGGVSPCSSCLYIPPTWPPSSLWSGCRFLLSLWKI